MALLVLDRRGGHKEKVRRARGWLMQREGRNTVTAAAGLIALAGDNSDRAHVKKGVWRRLLLEGQGSTGGWGPYSQSPAETFDTALALIALALEEQRESVEARKRGREFLMKEQQRDGGWPATTRPTGGESYAQRISTTAWALIGLLEHGPI